MWVQIVSIDTPCSSHRSALRDADLPSPPTIKPSPSHSHGQPGQLRRRGWAENHPSQAPRTAPCARRRPAQHRKAVASEGGASSRGASRRELEVVEGVQGHQAPCRTPPATPRTLPDTRSRRPMRLAKPQVAAPRPSMRTRRGAPASQLLHGAECGAAVSPAADPSNSHP